MNGASVQYATQRSVVITSLSGRPVTLSIPSGQCDFLFAC